VHLVRDGERHTRWSRGGRAGEGSPIQLKSLKSRGCVAVCARCSCLQSRTALRMGVAGAASTRAAPSQSLELPAVFIVGYVSCASKRDETRGWGKGSTPCLWATGLCGRGQGRWEMPNSEDFALNRRPSEALGLT
jgi:hypothetical protein